MLARLLATTLSATFVHAHLAPWHKGMYGLNGVTGSINYNTDDVVHPLYQLPQDQWCPRLQRRPQLPPADGDFLELPAGKSFMVEIASNRGETTLSFDGDYTTDWPDGQNYPDDYNVDTCITSPNTLIFPQIQCTRRMRQGRGHRFAISYTSDIKQVTPANLVVFTVRYHTPWKRVTYYDVPADMPACPAGGCICGWGWVPNGCRPANMPSAPRSRLFWCENNPDGCTKGPKQMIYWNQNEGNNIQVDGLDAAGEPKSPAYNAKCGFPDGAQNDIFTGAFVWQQLGVGLVRLVQLDDEYEGDQLLVLVFVQHQHRRRQRNRGEEGCGERQQQQAVAAAGGCICVWVRRSTCGKTRKARRAEAAERERRSEGVLDASQAECARLLGVLRPRSLSFCRHCPSPSPSFATPLATSDSLTHTHAARTTSTSHRYPPPWIPIGTSHLISSRLFHLHTTYIPRSLRAAITLASSTHARQPRRSFVVARPTTSTPPQMLESLLEPLPLTPSPVNRLLRSNEVPLDSEALVIRSIVSMARTGCMR
ncbi:hypothetical protein B0H14DRAFT_3572414 [Mycena olivaceomarginata]|nr:hypothetical protein B0H14DRAFT_3572414 [Mycena olivaceomarginata]